MGTDNESLREFAAERLHPSGRPIGGVPEGDRDEQRAMRRWAP